MISTGTKSRKAPPETCPSPKRFSADPRSSSSPYAGARGVLLAQGGGQQAFRGGPERSRVQLCRCSRSQHLTNNPGWVPETSRADRPTPAQACGLSWSADPAGAGEDPRRGCSHPPLHRAALTQSEAEGGCRRASPPRVSSGAFTKATEPFPRRLPVTFSVTLNYLPLFYFYLYHTLPQL